MKNILKIVAICSLLVIGITNAAVGAGNVVCTDPNAEVVNNGNGGSCKCIAGYISTSTLAGSVCVIDCAFKDPNSYATTVTTCACKPGFTGTFPNCIADCSQYPNTVLNAKKDACVCDAANGYTGTYTSCTFQCTAPNSIWSISLKACVCSTGFIGTYPNCKKDCSSDPNAVLATNDAANCVCKDGYTGQFPTCQKDCSADPRSWLQNGVCVCKSPNVGTFPYCHEDCSTKQYTQLNCDTQTCVCKDGFVLTNGVCTEQCSTIDPNSEFSTALGGVC